MRVRPILRTPTPDRSIAKPSPARSALPAPRVTSTLRTSPAVVVTLSDARRPPVPNSRPTRQARCGIDPHDAFLTCRDHGQRYRLAMTPSMDRTAAFRELHQAGTFVLPNPWDVGSAKYLASLGFKALASTSAGFAWTLGKADGEVTLDEKLAHLRAIVEAVDVPINADFEGGFAVEPEGVAANVRRAAETGVAGLSIEDSPKDGEAEPLYAFELAVDRVRAAREALDPMGSGAVLT